MRLSEERKQAVAEAFERLPDVARAKVHDSGSINEVDLSRFPAVAITYDKGRFFLILPKDSLELAPPSYVAEFYREAISERIELTRKECAK